jgi:hypothetical protein
MRYGVNINWGDLVALAPRARGIELDYVELRVGEALSPLRVDDATFRERAREVERLGLPIEAANVFLTPPIMVVGPDADMERFRGHVAVAVERLRTVGAGVVVWGSGPTRQIPEGFPRERAWEQLRASPTPASCAPEPASGSHSRRCRARPSTSSTRSASAGAWPRRRGRTRSGSWPTTST